MKRFSKLFITLFFILIFIGTFVFLYQKSLPKEITYEEILPETGDIFKTTVITGRIEPRDEISVKPQISGIITELYKEAGERVESGEVIARVKVIPDMGQLSSAEARVRLAKIKYDQACIDLTREQTLYDKELVSAEEYEKINQVVLQSAEELKAATDALEIVRDGVSKSNASASSTLIRSTISGVILDIPIRVGNTVVLSNTFNDGTTIATVADMNDLIFRGNIDETEVGRLSEGMDMKITIGALQNNDYAAKLEYISPKAVMNNGANQFEVKAAITVGNLSRIRSGYSANAEIVLDKSVGVLNIPESAIQYSGDTTFVYIVKKQGQEKIYERRNIVTGLSDGINVEVKSGLHKTDVVRGLQK